LEAATIVTAVGLLKLLPEAVEVGKDVWKKLKPPEKLAMGKGHNGVFDRTYYSAEYGFTISVPDNNWRFWEPSPQFVASLGPVFAVPYRVLPIIVLSNEMIRMFRPNVNVYLEDVGSFPTITQLMELTCEMLTNQGSQIKHDDIHISLSTNSGALITTSEYLSGSTMYSVLKMYIRASRAYYVSATYVPITDQSPEMFGGLQEVMNSFQFVEGA